MRSAESDVRSPCEVRCSEFVRSAQCEIHDGRPRRGRSSDRPIERVMTMRLRTSGRDMTKAATLLSIAVLITGDHGQRLREEASARRATDAAASGDGGHGDPSAATATGAHRRADGCAARAGARRQRRVEVAGRPQPRLTTQAGVLRARQRRAQPGVADDAAAERERAQEVPRPGRSPSRDTATSAARPSTTSRSANAARWWPATISCRWGWSRRVSAR